VKELKTRIERGLLGYSHRLLVLGYPARNALPNAQFQPVDYFGMRILGSAKNEIIALQHIDQAGVALHQRSGEVDYAGKHIVKAIRCRQPIADFVQQIKM
jgi:hypothetical protein